MYGQPESALTTAFNDRTDLHIARLHEAVTAARQPALEMLANLAQRFSSFGSDAEVMALKQLNQIAHRQAVAMAFADVFLLLTFLFLGLAALSIFMRRPSTSLAPDGH